MEYCRVCAKRKENCLEIFGEEGTRRRLAEKMETCLNIVVKKKDKLPLTLCPDCSKKLSEFSQFRDMGFHAQLWMDMCLVRPQQVKEEAEDEEEEGYTCDSCGTTFTDKAVLSCHVTTCCYTH